jgi:hypothetical protein
MAGSNIQQKALRSAPVVVLAFVVFAGGALAQAPTAPTGEAGAQTTLRLTAGERATIDRAEGPQDEALTEVPVERQLPPARPDRPETLIEQKRRGNRVVEVIVTPAGMSRSYTMTNRVGEPPLRAGELSSGLSTPDFFKIEF